MTCRACDLEAELGTEECPHPIDSRVHTCQPLGAPVSLEFEQIELGEEARPSFDAQFSLGTIGTSPDDGQRGWMVQFDALLEGDCADELTARRAAIQATRAQLVATIAELDAALAALTLSGVSEDP